MPLLVAAPDKFRGTASALEVAGAIATAAKAHGYEAITSPMSDGGEGFLDALHAPTRTSVVRGPLGEAIDARWSLLVDGTALIESAEAAGRALLTDPIGDDAVRASTYGVGQLVGEAVRAGASKVIVGCGGTATTDGGLGCVQALDDLGLAVAVPIVAACDVLVAFADAPAQFGPQKGASPDQVAELEALLLEAAATYRRRFGVDVAEVPGAGAAGGLAGGLVALGASIVPGARLVADAIGLAAHLDGAELVVTGEGRIDAGTLAGKVIEVVLSLRSALPAILVAGEIDPGVLDELRARRDGPVEAVQLDDGRQRRLGTQRAIAEAVTTVLMGQLS